MKNHALPAAEGGMQNAGPFKEGVMDDKGTLKYKLIRIGAGHFCGEVSVSGEGELLRECKKHLGSKGVDIYWDDDSLNAGMVVVGGFRVVGRVEAVHP